MAKIGNLRQLNISGVEINGFGLTHKLVDIFVLWVRKYRLSSFLSPQFQASSYSKDSSYLSLMLQLSFVTRFKIITICTNGVMIAQQGHYLIGEKELHHTRFQEKYDEESEVF